MKVDYIIVKCPVCGKEMDIPYLCDGTFEIRHTLHYFRCGKCAFPGCEKRFYIAIMKGTLHVNRSIKELKSIIESFGKE